MPTYRQKLVASKLSDFGGNIGKAMVAAGYSRATAKTPQKLTESKGWREIMENFLPDELLAKKHKALLDAKEPSIVIKALDLAYKVKGYYYSSKNNDSEKIDNLRNFNITDDQLERILGGRKSRSQFNSS